MNTESNQNKETKIEFTQESILHCIMHSATRSDIAELRSEVKADMSTMKMELKGDISKIDQRLTVEMQALRKDNNKYFRWIVGLMFGSFAGIALMILKFPLLK